MRNLKKIAFLASCAFIFGYGGWIVVRIIYEIFVPSLGDRISAANRMTRVGRAAISLYNRDHGQFPQQMNAQLPDDLTVGGVDYYRKAYEENGWPNDLMGPPVDPFAMPKTHTMRLMIYRKEISISGSPVRYYKFDAVSNNAVDGKIYILAHKGVIASNGPDGDVDIDSAFIASCKTPDDVMKRAYDVDNGIESDGDIITFIFSSTELKE